EWAVPVMLSKLALENVLLILGCALVELQIVFVSQDLQTLSACVLALVSMLRPLRWAGPLISALPANLGDYLDSPVPLILG
ncbi:DENN domain-containing protein, partial [Pelagophyceae sp. CCMP2097]